ncbi:molybdopterin-dependent oxidoreductase [Chloroflexota bacterium]
MNVARNPGSGEKIIMTTCSSHCGGACLLKVYVRDGVITRIETDEGEEPQLRACLRCRSYRQRVYDPDRLKFPMKRVGERGEGRFERISWDEALDAIVAELNRIRSTYGPAAVLFLSGGGDSMYLHSSALIQELLLITGGCTRRWGNHSFEGGLFSSSATYGSLASLGDAADLLNSRLIILWGWDPNNSIQTTGTSWYLLQAKEAGARIISVNPRYSNSAAVLASQWIPIIPGTDTAMLIAMAYMIIKEGLQDQDFINAYTSGFEQFKNYVLGIEDGMAKTPSWAGNITGVPADMITNLAREYATTRPAALTAGIGPGRTAYGEQYHRATEVLAAITGNTGVHGGWSGRFHSGDLKYGGFDYKLGVFPRSHDNPVEYGVPVRKDALPTWAGGSSIWAGGDSAARIHHSEIADAILKGKAGGYPADIKMLMVAQTNPVNQYANTNKMTEALKELEFIAVEEQVMSATARFADILLPVSTFMERNDVCTGGAPLSYGYVNKVIEPLYESKSPLEIAAALAERMGVPVYGDKTEDEWLREILKESYIPDYDASRKDGIYRVKLPEPRVAFKKQIEDPQNNPFPTPSGKIEIFSQKLADINDPKIPPIPQYIETWENRNDPLTARYPLQLLTVHSQRRAHSQFDSVLWLRELIPQAITISAVDAGARGISDGDEVRVFNDRGEVVVSAVVTERIMPGVVELPQGAWYSPDENGVDRGGCANVLTRDMRSPGGAACYHTCLVQVQKV